MANHPTVLIIGCGIAGPVLALLLKRKGYNPIVFEKVRQLGDVGASLMLMPNGMKVLNLVGLVDAVVSTSRPLERFQDFNPRGDLLGGSDLPQQFPERYSQPGVGVKRTVLNLMLKDALLANNIECRDGWGLEDVVVENDGVTAYFSEGRAVSGAFLVGCDGIKAKSREILLKAHNIKEDIPLYTGLSQTAGISLTPASLQGKSSMSNWYGNGIHIIAYSISPTHTSWAITQREAEQGKETWRLYNPEEVAAIIKDLLPKLEGFEKDIIEMVSSAQRLTKYGLFDRTQLEPAQWYWSRSVLAGDAAHPTSPHLGQGANQALEDCYHLSRALPDVRNGAAGPTEADLSQIFSLYAEKRQPRTARLVKGARAQGETRVLSGSAEDIERRDKAVAAAWNNKEATAAKFDALCLEPF
ncbi:FAD/NAD(P)-binding domain-containing protein [Thozetella sp. PMI_491]|nr:FAD/NAD(P)-binding domain-containing protein [Thozetella sp. PMI_491]